MIDTEKFCDALASYGINFFAGVPDSLLKDFCACIKERSDGRHNIICANEGNAVAVCAGHYLSTEKIGAVYMQNSGEGNAVNPLLSLTDGDVYSLPVLLIIGWRGEPGVHDEPQHVKQGKVTKAILDACGIEYSVLCDDWEHELSRAVRYMHEHSRPFALIIRKGTFTPYNLKTEPSPYKMKREEALSVILDEAAEDDIIVSTTGKTSREIFELREARGEGHGRDFLTVGSMGHTSSIAYGIAIGTERRVFCIDGDGSFIMHMGAVGVIGADIPENFRYIVNDNRQHESVGGQPTCSMSLDIPAVLRAAGFSPVLTAQTPEELRTAMRTLAKTPRAALVIRTAPGSRKDLGRPTTTPLENRDELMSTLRK